MPPNRTPTPPCKKDDRIKLVKMADDPRPIPAGTEGTVTSIGYFQNAFSISMNWDNGRTLSLVSPPDTFIVIETANNN